MECIRTDSSNPFFQKLEKELDDELTGMYGEEMEIFNPLNKLKIDAKAIVIIENNIAIGIGAFRVIETNIAIEIKRMFVSQKQRGRGISKVVLKELETWAIELGFSYAKLETGIENVAALGLYQKVGYDRIDRFGPYKNIEGSLCFGKKLK